uniref:Fibroblast growth factor receptor substrate 2-like n=1 Tax=Sinocyclocheilus rhinocerous TaxID=307959 RepID=A0A673JBA1_9TELE
MGSCWSCLYRDAIQDNHLNKFKVTNVDDEGNELGSGTMELTQTELILHTRKRDAIRWPYLCLRRYGYDSNLFSFESGRRCQTGQGIFAFKCSRAEEIFNLLQELMQCNSINVVEEPMIMTRPGHAPEMDMPRTPQTPNTPAFPMQGFPNGFPGYPISADSSQPSLTNDHRHSLMGLDDHTHTYVNTVGMETDLSSRHCVHSLPEVMHCCSLDDPHKDPQVFLQPGAQEVKFMLGPTPAQRHLMERDRDRHITHPIRPCPESQLTYENINGLRGGYGCDRGMGVGGHRRTALLNYENLPSLPPVWEYRALQREEEEDQDEDEDEDEYEEEEEEEYDEYEYSEGPTTPNGYHQESLGSYVNKLNLMGRGSATCEQHSRHPPPPPPSRQLNYIQVDLEGEPSGCSGHGGGAPVPQRPPPLKRGMAAAAAAPSSRRGECYAVIDLKKTAAMSNLQKAIPRDDGTSRKTRHNSTDLPL